MLRSNVIILFLLLISGLTHSKLLKRSNRISSRNDETEKKFNKISSCGSDWAKVDSFMHLNSERKILINLREINFI